MTDLRWTGSDPYVRVTPDGRFKVSKVVVWGTARYALHEKDSRGYWHTVKVNLPSLEAALELAERIAA